MKTYLFTSSRCHKCPEAKQFIADNNLDVEVVEADTSKKGMELAIKYGVQQVPVFVSDGKKYSLEKYKLISCSREETILIKF